jgi:CheY-like chemotaxis protein/HPt (histidine-containing phosphotransfer) domain-containing protein
MREPRRDDTHAAGTLAGARLLLVEDNEINREFATELLRSEGMAVDEAVNGQEAIEQVRRHDYDAVLMDIQMPVLDGLEAARRIRALAAAPGGERYARLPIIAMTALAMAQDAEQSRAAGMNDHITKPIAPEQLLAALTRWVRLPAERAATAAPAAAAAHGGELPSDLRALSALDAHEGVRRIGGKAEAYRRQLQRFREHYPDAINELRRLIRQGDLQRAEEHCHSLKGVSGNIGAQALFEHISAIDGTLKQGSVPEAAALSQAETLLGQVLHEIDGLAAGTPTPPPPVAAPLAGAALRTLLQQLQHVLEYDLGAAEALLAQLRAGVAGTALEGDVATLAARVDVFDIDDALARLEKIEASLTGTTP